MSAKSNISAFLEKKGINFAHFIDISALPKAQNKGYTKAILFGMVLSAKYLEKVGNDPNHVENMIRNKEIKNDEFHLSELKTDRIADELSDLLTAQGHKSYSQSEANIEATGFYDKENYLTPLPHKTLALMAGMGWIGKHNLLVTPKYGSGISMSSVLCDAPWDGVKKEIMQQRCGTCKICVEVCKPGALTGNNWDINKPRTHVVDVKKCTTCYQCVVHCPWTKKYIQHKLS